ncbi:MAG: leucine-rich repeat protein, partial [Eubacteriales bacterium]|nr:leucine-rich repeat protein [Eubacteriales bacterium]
EDAIRYKFSPTEDGLYQLTYDEGLGCDLYSEKTGYMVNKYWRGNSKVYYLKEGETYKFDVGNFSQEDEVTEWKFQMTKMSEKTIDADQVVYQEQENEPIYYRFKAKTAGSYLINDGVEVSSMEIFSDSWSSYFGSPIFLDMDGFGRWLTYVSLEQGEEIVLLARGENKSVCVSSVKNVDGFEYIWQVDGTVAIRGYSGEKKDVVIPDEIDGKPVTSILPFAFSGSDIESVVLPSTLKEITRGAFYRSNIESVVLPSTLEKIGENAFRGTKLKEIVIPDSVTDIGAETFCNCASLKKVVIGSGLELIHVGLFENCDSLEEVVIPGNGSVTRIEYDAFSGCTSLSKIALPDTIEFFNPDAGLESTAWYKNLPDEEVYIGKVLYTYKGTVPKGTKVTVKPGTAFINYGAYDGQTGVSEVILPYGLKEIGEYAFVCGDNMKSIVIPASVTWIGWKAVGYKAELSENGNYYDCKKLDDFVIYGQKGTAAEEYAIENGFEFVEKAPFARGDVDLSGKVDISDLRLMLRAVCGKVTLAPDQIAAGDITGSSDPNDADGKITIADLRRLLRFICGKIEAL